MPVPALFVLVSPLLLGQVDATFHNDPSRGLTLFPVGSAYVGGALAPSYNPAGLAHAGTFEMVYAHERTIARGGVNDGVFFSANPFEMFGMGLSVEWMRVSGAPLNNFRKTRFSLGAGGEGISAGVNFNWFNDGMVDRAFSFDLGLQTRFSRWVSLGGTIRNVDQPTRYGITLPRQYALGVGLRPLRERLTVGIDWTVDERTGVEASRLSYSLDAGLISGVHLFVGLSHRFDQTDLFAQLGIRIDTSHFGVGYAIGNAAQGFNHLGVARISLDKVQALPIRDGVIAVLEMGSLGKRDNLGTVGSLLGVRPADRYLKTLTALNEAARDPKLKGLLIKVETSDLGIGRAQELRQAIQHLKDAGKKVVALVLSCNDPDYLVVSAADYIYAVPQSMLAIDGLQSNVHFFGQAAQKVGVHFDVARVGRYKNSPDQFTRSEMSDEQREVINAYLDTDVKVFSDAVTASRRLSKEQWQAAVDEGIKSAPRSKQLGLIDDVLTPAEIEERLPQIIPGARLDTDYRPLDVRNERWGFERRIAIVPVSGNISGGKDSTDPLGLNATAGADSFVRALNDAVNDPQVAAIVLRIDSPGGDGLASELMYRAVLQAKKKKPVVASMGDIAASGGYYAAMGADEIWAEHGTITGSIGVFYLKPSVSELAQKLGVHEVSINRGALAGEGDLFQPWTEPQRQAAQKWIDTFYDSFISEVAASRKKPKEAIDAVAQGRVWSGEAAQERGLVDHLGGLREAVNAAKKRAGLSETSETRWVIYGGRSGLVSSLVESKAAATVAAPTLPVVPESAVQGLAQTLHLESWQFQPGAKTHMGWSLEVR